MKKLFVFFVLVTLTNLLFAQTPDQLSYQAVVRDAAGNPVTNQNVGFQISIISGSITGTVEYVETHTASTNLYGIVVLNIGSGLPVTGTFSTIAWGSNSFFIKIEADPTGGISYVDMGTTQLLSVPYALHAKTAENITGTITETDPVFGTSPANGITNTDITSWNNKLDTEMDGSITNEIQALSISNDTVYLSNGGFVKLPAGFNGQYSSLTGAPTNVSAFTNDTGYLTSFTEVDGSITNELQALTLSNDTIYLSNGGFVKLPAGFNGQYSSLTGAPTNVSAFTNDAGYLISELDGSVTNELQTLSISNDTVYLSNGGFVKLPINAWSLNGNTGTNPATNFVGTKDANDLVIKTNNTEKMRVSSNGNVGIGTTTPAVKLDVKGNAKFGASGMINIWEWDAIEKIGLDYNTVNGDFNMRNPVAGKRLLGTITATGSWGIETTAGNEMVRITGSGNMGIGTTSPAALLHVKGGAIGQPGKIKIEDADATGLSSLELTNNTGNTFYFYKLSSGYPANGRYTQGVSMIESNNANGLAISEVTGDIHFYTGGNNERITINNSGNVGIGTTTPNARLEIVGQVKITGGTPGAGKILTSDAGGLASWQAAPGDNLGNHTATQNINLNGFALVSGGTRGLKMDSRGNIGINMAPQNTSSNDVNLDILSPDGWGHANVNLRGYNWATNSYKCTRGSGCDFYSGAWWSDTYNEHLFFLCSDGAEFAQGITIRKNSNVGIGTQAPSTKLDVNGVITATGGNSTNWNNAYGWGNHALAGYLTSEVDGSITNEIQTLSISNDTIYLTGGGFAKIPEQKSVPALINYDDFSCTALKSFWTCTTTGGAAYSFNWNNLESIILSTNGGNTIKLRSNRQKSVTEGKLIFSAVSYTYEDNNTAYGPLSRGLVNGTDRNNAIEFINVTGSIIQARTVLGGVATTTNYAVGASVGDLYSYTIIATNKKVEFYFNGTLIATHTTNIPTLPLNMYFDASTPGGNVPQAIDDAKFEIIKY